MNPPVPPAVVAACPYSDSIAARIAGDSIGRRVPTDGHILVGAVSGIVAGFMILPASTSSAGETAKGVVAASLATFGINWAVAANRSSVPRALQTRIADCDTATRAAFSTAYGVRASKKRSRNALLSGLAAIVLGAAALVGVIVVALSHGGFT
jgi:hypothetical protein